MYNKQCSLVGLARFAFTNNTGISNESTGSHAHKDTSTSTGTCAKTRQQHLWQVPGRKEDVAWSGTSGRVDSTLLHNRKQHSRVRYIKRWGSSGFSSEGRATAIPALLVYLVLLNSHSFSVFNNSI